MKFTNITLFRKVHTATHFFPKEHLSFVEICKFIAWELNGSTFTFLEEELDWAF